ncbi:MAG TPA: hypothetical protein VM029_22170 [Opitutaceae bacterium]|nr:hypothetical protein [Opitutaceae bacterium]
MSVPAASRARLSLPLRGWRLVALASLLLLLRKSWALHTPQLYAEDGSIFLAHDDEHGIRAWWDPYMGYLHLLPRMIAWFASHVADVAWWPVIYNGLSFAITAGLFARLASARVDLPGKPWLAAAFAFVPHPGEVLFNITNLQWITAFFLLLQVIMKRPETMLARIVDLVIVFLVGLTGPFALVFLPLFAWRWWRARNSDTLAVLLVAGVCAGIQSSFILRSQIGLLEQPMASSPFMLAQVLGTRLIAWPLLGARIARALPGPLLTLLGSVGLVAFLGWVLRPHARRALRAPVVAALVMVLGVSMVRLRPDTWDSVDLVNGDRYFFIPRVLLAWLVIGEFDTSTRAVAFGARAACVLGALANLPDYVLPTPPDYHWALNCDPIRRGVPANIYTLPEGWWIEYPGRPGRK